MTNKRAGLYYLALYVPALVAGLWLEDYSIEYENAHSLPSAPDTWRDVFLSVGPALVAGFAVFLVVAPLVHFRVQSSRGLRAHLTRCAPLYALAGVLTSLILLWSGYEDFYMIAQLLLWPTCVAIGAVLADVVMSRFHRRSDGAAA